MGIKGAILGDIIGSKWEFCGCKDPYKVELFEPLNKDENDNILNEKRTDDEIMERFDYGLIESGKLTSKMFPGGKILYDSTFTLVDI